MRIFKCTFYALSMITVILTGCEQVPHENPDGPTTIQKYNKLENTMGFDDVIEILGSPDYINFEENTSDKVEFEDEYTRYSWDGVAPNSNIILYFRDGKLYKKEQVGLD